MKTDITIEAAEPAQFIPLDALYLSPLNPRQKIDPASVTEMADSLRMVGMMQNLGGLVDDEGRVGVVFGGRRLRAWIEIAAGGEAVPPLPVLLAKDEAEARVWAMSENAARTPLTPADEVRSYAAMAEMGAPPETIAKAFAVTVRHVKGRMRLAALPAPILDALGAGDITLDVAAAYTVSADPARQLEAFERLKSSWNGDSPDAIRRLLTSDATGDDDRLARIVGRAAYEAAGGAIREDLFGEDVYCLDGELLAKLAQERLDAAAREARAEGWKWVESGFDRLDWSVAGKMGRTYPERAEPEDGAAERYDELAELIESGAASDEDRAAFADLSARLDAELWTGAQKAHAGAYVRFDHDGAIVVDAGLVKPEDRAAAAEAGVCRPVCSSGSGAASSPKGPYPAALASDLAMIRTGAVQAAMLKDPALALDLLTFAVAFPVYSDALPLLIRTEDAANAPKGDEGMVLPERLETVTYAMPMTASAAAAAFTAFRAKPKKARTAILTESIARTFRTGLAGPESNPFAELIAATLDVRLRSVWTPTTGFLKRLTAAQLDAIHEHVFGQPNAAFRGQKKGAKVAWLHALFTSEDDRRGLSAEARERLAAWTPEGMAPADEAEDGVESEAA